MGALLIQTTTKEISKTSWSARATTQVSSVLERPFPSEEGGRAIKNHPDISFVQAHTCKTCMHTHIGKWKEKKDTSEQVLRWIFSVFTDLHNYRRLLVSKSINKR